MFFKKLFLFFGVKRSGPFMVYKGVIAHYMMITCLLCTVAEIIFLPVASAERFSVKDTDVIDHTAFDIHTETNRNGDPWITSEAARFNQSGVLIYRDILRYRIVLAHDRNRT